MCPLTLSLMVSWIAHITEVDDPDPLNHYAKTKLLGEKPVLECGCGTVLRTNILGLGLNRKTTFFDWLLKGLQSGDKLTLV